MEGRKKKAREWQVRLQEDIKTNKGAKFITLTFSNEAIQKIYTKLMEETPDNWDLKGFELDNKIAIYAMRHFNERYRKKYKKALRHWTITELGHQGTENIHLHGIIWPQCTLEEIETIWQYGWIWKYKLVGGVKLNYVNARTVNYLIKYVSKRDEIYPNYKSKVLCSPGIGNNYTKTPTTQLNKFNDTQTRENYRTETGHKIALPKYWRNKIYTDLEREQLWMNNLDKQTAYVCGEQVTTKYGNEQLFELRKYYRKKNRRLGYGSYHKNEDLIQWQEKRRAEKFVLRITNAQKRTTAKAVE